MTRRPVIINRTDDLGAALAIRAAVFIDEQGVSLADEVDGLDPDCIHWLATDAEGPVATLRVMDVTPEEGPRTAKIQRVAVLPRARGTGLGAILMRDVLEDLQAEGYVRAILGAQSQVTGFYEALGFAAHGPTYDDAGIPHQDMTREL
ncbi:GNAT family N-acetyltransferase [Jannaschia sp. KMU-145]|uniref:GNAT family N-acetyltransferase n=1 Tax=Jannaschia halovivens TaxID=3388667 RepID=UPI00396B1B0B